MKIIKSALDELKNSLLFLSLFNSFIDSLVFFLIMIFFVLFLPISWYWALLPSGLFLIINSWRKIKAIKLKDVEEKVPVLYEQIRTAADNIDRDNAMVQSLNQDVIKKMKKVRTSYFLNFNKLSIKMVLIAVFSFFIILFSSFNVQLPDIGDILENIRMPGFISDRERALQEQEALLVESEHDIYGESSIAELGDKELELEIKPIASELDLSKVKEVEEREFKSEFPIEIYATADASFDDNIPKENQKIVKNYFNGIRAQ
jgi:hypothetical protein